MKVKLAPGEVRAWTESAVIRDCLSPSHTGYNASGHWLKDAQASELTIKGVIQQYFYAS